MSIVKVFYTKRGKLDTLELDATLREDHSIAGDPTMSPAEVGADLNDHIRLKPRAVTLIGEVSKTPLNPAFLLQFTRYKEAFRTLEKLVEDRKTFTVITSLKEYKNMYATSISIPRESSTSNVLRFTATLIQMRLVNTNPSFDPSSDDLLNSGSDLGDQSGSVL